MRTNQNLSLKSKKNLSSFLLAVIFVILCSLSVRAEVVDVVKDDGSKGTVNNYYIPTKHEKYNLRSLTLSFVNKNETTGHNKYIRYVRDFISDMVSFEYGYKDYLQRGEFIVYSPYAVFQTKTMVCTGYSMLAKNLFDARKIENVLVHDTKKNHMFNRVRLNEKWIDLDITNYDAKKEYRRYLRKLKLKIALEFL